jgi:hypothetical protein
VALVRPLAALALSLAFPAPLAAAPGDAGPAPVEIVSVAANTGNAAGGHVALRLGDQVYHFEVHGDGLLHLTRERWSFFRTRYADLENRSLRAVRLAIASEAGARIGAHLAALHATQRWELERLEALGLQALWLEGLGGEAAELPLRAVGLFSASGRDDPDALNLLRAIEVRHGTRFVAEEREEVETALGAGSLEPGDLDGPAAERLRDRLLLREALRVLAEARPLAPEAVVDPDAATPGDPGRPLLAHERERLARSAADLEASVLRLVRSQRPDRGRPLLLAAARYQAARRSLAAGRLLLLDAFGDAAPALTPTESRRQRPLLEALAGDARESWLGVRERIFAQGDLDEYAEHELEEAGSLYAELRGAAAGERLLRVWDGETKLPDRRGWAALPRVAVEPEARMQALLAARTQQARYRAQLEQRYGYRLLQRNCATELARATESSFDDPDEARRALGGELRAGPSPTFVPALMRRAAGRRLAAASERQIPSYRERRVAALEREGSALLVALRESNTWTARAYRPSFGDDPFLWFSDGPLPLRPVQGALNVGYGLLFAGIGAAALPFDGGRSALAGLRGALYSLPELVGWNLRKGRYDRLPPAPAAPSLGTPGVAP